MSQAIVPISRVPVTVRPATPADVGFIDALQKMHTHMVGWQPTEQIEGKIAAGHVLVAEGRTEDSGLRTESGGIASAQSSVLSTQSLGYVISQDRYMGHDELGIIYQLNVSPVAQRKLVGATLIKAVFERAAYGCRLFCCWCAQDIAANYFWESIGFRPLAFRAGSRGKQRVHIFWQRRIREGDASTPWWFPFETRGGAIREDRIVLPIPPGTHWRDAKPIILPGMREQLPEPATRALTRPARPPAPAMPIARKMAIVRSQSKHLGGLAAGKAAVITSGGLRYIDRADYVPEPEVVIEPPKPKRAPKPRGPKKEPKFVAAARELRDRYLEHVNGGGRFALPQGKYAVGILPTGQVTSGSLVISTAERPALPAPAARAAAAAA